MAMIDRIRSKSWLVIVVVGLGLVLFLIPPDAFASLFGKGQNPDIGAINGRVMKAVEWNDLVAKRRGLFNYNSGNNSVYNDVWNDYIERTMLEAEYRELGLVITEEELEGIMFGENLSPYVLRTHYNNMDTLSRETVRTQWEQIQIQNIDYYTGHIEIIKQRRLKEKFDNLLKKGLYANKLDGKYSYAYNNDVVNIQYVTKSYVEIADSLITWTDADVRAYYNKHKQDEEWKNAEDSRVVEFIYFSVTPTALDSADLKSELEALKSGWSAADNDSAFVAANTATGTYVKLNYADGDFAGTENARLTADSTGSIVGPYHDGGFMRIAKILGRELNTTLDSSHVRHILLGNDNKTKDMAMLRTKADSLKREIQKNKNFEAMVTQYSEDPGSKNNGGKYWVRKGQMVPEFEKASFEGKIGDLQIINTDYGVHIVEVIEYDPEVMETKISVIDKPIVASERTLRAGKGDAQNFSIAYTDSVSFRTAADTMGMNIQKVPNLRRTDQNAAGLKNPGELISWAYNSDTEIGQVSHPMQIDDQIVIALLTDKKEKGVPSFANVKDKAEKETINEKKAEYIIEKMKTGNNLEEIAAAVGGAVKTADGMKMMSNVVPGNNGNEFEVVGLAFGIPVGEMSLPIKGKSGVYVISPTSEVKKAEAKESYLDDQSKLVDNWQSRTAYGPFNSMKDNARIKDNRYGE